MPRPSKWIPEVEDIKCLKTLLKEGKNQVQIAEYYSTHLPHEVSRQTVQNRIKWWLYARNVDTVEELLELWD